MRGIMSGYVSLRIKDPCVKRRKNKADEQIEPPTTTTGQRQGSHIRRCLLANRICPMIQDDWQDTVGSTERWDETRRALLLFCNF